MLDKPSASPSVPAPPAPMLAIPTVASTTLAKWQSLVRDLGDLGDALCAAIEAQDSVAAMSVVHQSRRVRAELARVEAPILEGTDAEIESLRAGLVGLRGRVVGAEAVIDRWLQRPLPGDARLTATPLGAAILADAMLPAVWDFDADLVVFVGNGFEIVAEILADLQQRRVVALTSGGSYSERVITVASTHELASAIRTMYPCQPSRFVVRAELGVERGQVDDVVTAVRGALGEIRIHRNTLHAFSRTWIEQGAANIPAVASWPSLGSVGDHLRGVPMVIVAPGPSLAKNVAQLHQLKGRAIITAFSHSLRPVLAAGVVPDLVVTVDPQDVRYHFAEATPEQLAGIGAIVNGATVHPSLYHLGAKRYLTLSANCGLDDWLFAAIGENADAPGGGSVATTTFSLARRLGCDPIIFVGLDLSFPGGQYYVATSTDAGATADVDANGLVRVSGWSKGFAAMKAHGGPQAAPERAVELPGWHGGTVPSSFMFSMFHRWFVEQLATTPATPTSRVYNCTEGGSYIAGMDHRPFAAVVSELVAADVRCDVPARLDALVAATDGSGRRHRFAQHLATLVSRMTRAQKLAMRCIELSRAGDLAPLERAEADLARTLRPISFISMLAQHELDHAYGVAMRDGDVATYLQESRRLFIAVGAAIAVVLPRVREAAKQLRAVGASSSGDKRARRAHRVRR